MHPYLLHMHERPLTLVKFNYDGDFFITCAKDGDVCLIRTDTCERIGTYCPKGETKAGAVYAVDITMDSKYVITANSDGLIVFYTFEGEMVKKLNHGGIVKYCEFNQKPGEQNLVVTCNDKFKSQADGLVPNRIMIWKWDEKTGKIDQKLCIDSDLPMKASKVKWGPFDETLVSIFDEGTVAIWDAASGKQLQLFQAHASAVTSMNFDSDRTLMITSSKDHTCKLWAMDSVDDGGQLECVKTYKSDRPLNDACISPLYNNPDNEKMHLLMAGGQDAKDVTTTAASSGKFEAQLFHMVYEEEIGNVKGHFGPINTIAFMREGNGFVTGGEDGYVRVHHFDPDYFTSKKFE